MSKFLRRGLLDSHTSNKRDQARPTATVRKGDVPGRVEDRRAEVGGVAGLNDIDVQTRRLNLKFA